MTFFIWVFVLREPCAVLERADVHAPLCELGLDGAESGCSELQAPFLVPAVHCDLADVLFPGR